MYPELTAEEVSYVYDCVREFTESRPEANKSEVRR
jgi:hypothetical protein